MHTFARVVVAAAALAGLCSVAQAKVHIIVDLDRQTMHVEAKDQVFDWKVSSGKFGYETPAGKYGVLWMDKDHHSDEYNQTPMPDAIFFAPGYAIHGAYKSAFGHPASHGCVRLPVAKAAVLFDLVKAQGAEVTITGDSPATIAADHSRRRDDAAGPDAGYYGPDARGYDARGYGDVQDGPQPIPAGGYGPLFNSVY